MGLSGHKDPNLKQLIERRFPHPEIDYPVVLKRSELIEQLREAAHAGAAFVMGHADKYTMHVAAAEVSNYRGIVRIDALCNFVGRKTVAEIEAEEYRKSQPRRRRVRRIK